VPGSPELCRGWGEYPELLGVANPAGDVARHRLVRAADHPADETEREQEQDERQYGDDQREPTRVEAEAKVGLRRQDIDELLAKRDLPRFDAAAAVLTERRVVEPDELQDGEAIEQLSILRIHRKLVRVEAL
jgi:hypothetical protein